MTLQSRRCAPTLAVSLILAVVLLIPCVGRAIEPSLLEGRSVVIHPALSPVSLVPVEGEPASFSIAPVIPLSAADKPFALVLSGVSPEDTWTVNINGLPFELDALYAEGIAAWQIQPGYLKGGDNTILVTAPSDKTPPPSGATIFSLENFAEEERFAHLLLGPTVLVQPPTDPNQDKMDVLHCDLSITLDMNAATIPSGEMTMTAASLDSTLNTCVLDFEDNGGAMVVDSVDSGPSTAALPFTHNGSQNRIFITLPSAVSAGTTFTVRVQYHGTPPSNTGWRRRTHNGAPLIYTIGQPPYNARLWWPCKDVPSDKFTADVHVTCPDASYNGYPLSVVSNGNLESVVDNGSTLTFNWSEAYPLASQYVSITCTNYRAASGTYTALNGVTTMPVAHHVYPESYASESQELPRTIEVMEFFADTFGEYPFLTEKYWTSTWGGGGGMEHQTCTSMPNNNLNNPPYHRRNVHELAHMWFGDAIGINSFDHLWISEGWATYCEALWLEHKEGLASYHNRMNTWSTSDAVPIVDPSADSFTLSITYYKGAWVLHMLRHVIGDTAFFDGTRNYMADPTLRYEGAADSGDVQSHYEATYGQDLSWFFDQWLYRASRPYYNWTWSTTQNGGDTTVHIGIQQTQSDAVYTMPIDIRSSLAGGGTANFTVDNDQRIQNFAVNIGPGTVQSVSFDPDNWILDAASQVAASTPTEAPVLESVIGGPGTDRMTVTWAPYSVYGLVGFRLYMSEDGATGWTLVEDESVLGANTTTTEVTGLAPGDTRYFGLMAVANGQSPPSNVLSATIPGPPSAVTGWIGY